MILESGMSVESDIPDANNDSGTICSLYDLLCSDTPGWGYQRVQRSPPGPQRRLEKLSRQFGNRFCADCGSPDPKWVSSNLGVFICIKCSGIHRSLGVHISKVLSVKLDDWTDEEIDALESLGGNFSANEKYEAHVPDQFKKPKPDSSVEDRLDFIRRKYEFLQFLNSDEQQFCPSSPPEGSSSLSASNKSHEMKCFEKQATRTRIGQAFRNSWGRKDLEHRASKKSNSWLGMVVFVGLIKVNVVRGTNLCVRDVMTSDPYVILNLGQQTVKTRVIRSNLNPVWNESLLLSIPEHVPPLKVLVYDRDAFKPDDFMGEAEIDILPLLSAAKAYESSNILEPVQLGKSVACTDNLLLKDGVINLVDGRVRQEVCLRLQGVERGTLEVELECVPLSQ